MKRRRQKQTSKTPLQQLRIIGGQWRGRKVAIADNDGLRPTGDRIRETLFNWLMHDIVDTRCLDMFSGSGALGFETLSRGAASVVMVEKSTQACELLRHHKQQLGAKSAEVINNDSLAWLDHYSGQPFDIVFIDPPFPLNLWEKAIQTLDKKPLLNNNAMVYIETPIDTLLPIPSHWQLHREQRSGAICYRLFQCLS